jgi:hypothetical protein
VKVIPRSQDLNKAGLIAVDKDTGKASVADINQKVLQDIIVNNTVIIAAAIVPMVFGILFFIFFCCGRYCCCCCDKGKYNHYNMV